ncbi:transposase [Rhizobium sp. SG_E_25_P2]|uniref:transposase n=1 Tax=Rhizobium sp. SG_E_25_P2 TaxID=2879942 RepID=UPI002476B743|nr:transposase [Rhizobium sp. SG_E_25_P2]MDH6269538.1 transposase [Rhizobium sp. SG_E_25_P2]
MARPHPIELRQRVVCFVELGHSHREAARIFQVSVRFVNDMVLLKARTGDLLASPQGGWRGSKLADHESFVLARIDENGDLTLDDLRKELAERGLIIHRSSIGRLLARHKRSCKKNGSRQRAVAGGCQPPPRLLDRQTSSGDWSRTASRCLH